MEIEAATLEKRRNISTISMHKQSRTLAKSKPKIRIIHIFAPEIIKTDVSNFREIVQNLTGKQDHHPHQKVLKRNPRSRRSHDHQVHDIHKSHGFCINSEAAEEEGMVSMTWNGSGGSSGGFLNGLGDYDGFIHELDGFPYFPLTIDPPLASSHLHGSVFVEPHQYS
ncbi:hypothetical protein CARUB_v10025399mg [Capsella rubella]|uniref:VQ domain-containing protein n=1 Tax=Capsella rubella TaxID=81985 RepID=R0G1K7_9BRAS|nr:VQ motif-containing protein 17 [Capsella rubella]EOA29131.1 hypothetical protein CARUB_v10025399mg [Capsella rubella]